MTWQGSVPTPPPARVDFNRDIRPILSANCFACHGQDPAAQQAGCAWKPGPAYRETDELAYYIGRDKVTIRDLQTTILHQLGLDPFRFSYRYQGLNNRLIGPTDEGRVVRDILA